MTLSQILFYLLLGSILFFAFLSVTTSRIVRAAMFLLFALAGIAGFYFWTGFEFVGAVQVVVYAGGIVVLLIFAVFLTHKAGEAMPVPSYKKELAAFLASFLGFALCFFILNREKFFSGYETGAEPLPPNVMNIGLKMLDMEDGGFVLPFEVVSILLLAAMVGAIVIAMKEKKDHAA